MIAVVDESILPAGMGCYAIAVVCLPTERKTAVRRSARHLTPSGRRQFHWKDEEDRERFAMLRLLATEAVHLRAYVQKPAPRRKHERIRESLFRLMLADIGSEVPLVDLLIESRQPHNDRRDLHVIAKAQREGMLSIEVDYRHSDPYHEPLLWRADALAGAVTSQARKEGQYLAALPTDRLTVRGS